MDELPQLPPTSWVDVPHYTYTAQQMRAYAAAAVAQERERIKASLIDMDEATSRHNYYAHAAWVLFEREQQDKP